MIHKPLIWPAGAIVQACVGLDMLLEPDDFQAIYDRYHFAQVHRPLWGWAMLTVGLLTVGARFAPTWQRVAKLQHEAATGCVFALVFLYAAWASIWGSIRLVTDEQISVIPPLVWGLITFAVAVDAAQHGTSRAP